MGFFKNDDLCLLRSSRIRELYGRKTILDTTGLCRGEKIHNKCVMCIFLTVYINFSFYIPKQAIIIRETKIY